MALNYLKTMLTKDVLGQQSLWYGKSYRRPSESLPDELGDEEIEFVRSRDSFYVATVNADSWPYIQHRGGPRGFLSVLNRRTLAFPDFPGNRQLISAGNLQRNDRVSLFLMDYPNRARLKILGHAEIRRNVNAEIAQIPEIHGEGGPKPERWFVVRVEGFDWNCPKYITPRYTVDEIDSAVRSLLARVEELERMILDANHPAAARAVALRQNLQSGPGAR